MEWAQLVLKYLEAVIWPGVVVGLVWFLRDGVEDRLRAMTGLQAPGVSATFTADRVLEQEIEEQGRVLGTATPPTESAPAPLQPVPQAVEGAGAGSVQTSATGTGEVTSRRQAVEELVQATAAWAAERQANGLSISGVRVTWDEKDRPRLKAPSTMPRTARNYTLADAFNAEVRSQAERLEERVMELNREVKELRSSPGVHSSHVRAAEEELREMRDQLIRLDPNSPYAL